MDPRKEQQPHAGASPDHKHHDDASSSVSKESSTDKASPGQTHPVAGTHTPSHHEQVHSTSTHAHKTAGSQHHAAHTSAHHSSAEHAPVPLGHQDTSSSEAAHHTPAPSRPSLHGGASGTGSKPRRKLDWTAITLATLIIVVVIDIFLAFGIHTPALPPTAADQPLPVITATVLSPATCADCSGYADALDSATALRANLSTKTLTWPGAEADALVKKYGITKLPAIVLEGDLPSAVIGYHASGKAFVWDTPQPVYLLSNGSAVGRVKAILLTTVCDNCSDPMQTVLELQSMGITVASTDDIAADSAEGQALLSRYNVSSLPIIILSPDAWEYDFIAQNWQFAGTKESDGWLVQRRLLPPYVDVTTGATIGLVSATYINDTACADCYDVLVHRDILQRFGVFLVNETVLDATDSSAIALMLKYNVTAIPTVVVSAEAQKYEGLMGVWDQVGSVEADGSLVFRDPTAIQGAVYRNVINGVVISGVTS
ncbi:hypothetical protein AUJ68_03775 [Candidatus Woesearchaeota archaeon CG1_02_57_44]|nr:MAG: hypothetical protein AUJ68_03775 [Candidatus Woesearchaeota archaeon CG1_02_57_44]